MLILLVSACLIIFLLVFLYTAVPFIYGRCTRLMLKHKTAKFDVLVLTFDDGPGSRLTPTILHILKEYSVKATFFLLGRNITGREPIVKQIAAEGHEICSHGYDHLHYWKVSPIRAIRDIKKGWKAIDAALDNKHSKYPFRPPYGKLNLVALLYLWSKRVPIIFWTTDIGDTWSVEKRKNRIDQEWAKLQEGAVVLAHDFDRTTDGIDDYVLKAVHKCLMIARENQLKVCSVLELMKAIK